MEKLKNTRILGAIGIIALILGITLPYFTFTFFGYSKSLSLWDYWEGKVMMTLTIANLLFIFKDYVQKYAPQLFRSSVGEKIENANPKLAIVPTILVAGFAIWLYLRLDVDTTYLKHELGFWSLWIGVIFLVAHTFLYQKSAYNNLISGQVEPKQENNVNQGMNPSVKYCPGCGNPCNVDADRCFMCGRIF